jgi:hypothetical protein
MASLRTDRNLSQVNRKHDVRERTRAQAERKTKNPPALLYFRNEKKNEFPGVNNDFQPIVLQDRTYKWVRVNGSSETGTWTVRLRYNGVVQVQEFSDSDTYPILLAVPINYIDNNQITLNVVAKNNNVTNFEFIVSGFAT